MKKFSLSRLKKLLRRYSAAYIVDIENEWIVRSLVCVKDNDSDLMESAVKSGYLSRKLVENESRWEYKFSKEKGKSLLDDLQRSTCVFTGRKVF
jgi:hypothetical protein